MITRTQCAFLLVALLGTIMPLWFFAQFVLAYGFSPALFASQLFQTPVSRFFAMDVMVSALTLWLFVFREGRRLRMARLWVYVVCTLIVGVSLALPLFLFFRERHLAEVN